MGFDVMMSMVKLLIQNPLARCTCCKPPKVNSKELPQCMYIYVIIRGRRSEYLGIHVHKFNHDISIFNHGY